MLTCVHGVSLWKAIVWCAINDCLSEYSFSVVPQFPLRTFRAWESPPSPLSLPTLPSPPFTAKGGPMSLHTPPAPLCNSGLKAVVIPSYPPYERNLYNTTQDRYNLLQCAVKPEAMQARSHTKCKNIYTDNISRYNLLSWVEFLYTARQNLEDYMI